MKHRMKMLSIVIFAFITIILGAVLIQNLGSEVNSFGVLDTVVNDTFTSSNTSCVAVTTGCIDSISAVQNASIVLKSGNYTLCSVYTTYDGIQLQSASTFNGIPLNATYIQSAGCSYVNSPVSRSLANVIIILFAIAILVGGIYYVRESGLLDQF